MRAWMSAGIGIVLAVLIFVGLPALADSPVAHWARGDPDRPTAGACVIGLDELARDHRDGVVDCREPHRAVVLGRVLVGEHQPFPGDDAVRGEADRICAGMWAAQDEPADGPWTYGFVWPDHSTWNDGSRSGWNDVTCLVLDRAGAPLPPTLAVRPMGEIP